MFEHFPTLLTIPLPVAAGKGDNLPLGIDKKGYRYPAHAVSEGDGRIGVQYVQKSQILVSDIIFYDLSHLILTPPVSGDGKYDQAFTQVVTVDLFERGPLPATVRSPGGPEVQHNQLSLEIL